MSNHNGNANKMVSDTPRTDEQINGKPCTRYEVYLGDALRDAWVPSQFARQLERELNAANDKIKELEEWKRSALEVEREWDANAIATMLGGRLGESQREVVQREVPKLLARIKRLEQEIQQLKISNEYAWQKNRKLNDRIQSLIKLGLKTTRPDGLEQWQEEEEL